MVTYKMVGVKETPEPLNVELKMHSGDPALIVKGFTVAWLSKDGTLKTMSLSDSIQAKLSGLQFDGTKIKIGN